MPKQLGDMTLYSVLELSKKLSVSAVTLRKYLKEGKLKGQKFGNRYLVPEDSLKEFFNGGNDKDKD